MESWMMLGTSGFDGFISKRDKGAEFAEYLIAKLGERFNINVASQKDLANVDHFDHEAAARQVISTTAFTIVVLSEEGLDASFETGSDDGSYQLREIKVAAETRRTRGQNPPYRIFIIDVVDNGTTEMREARGVELAERAGLELRNPDYEQVSTTGSTDGSWYDDTRKICDTIKAFLSDNAIPLAPQQT